MLKLSYSLNSKKTDKKIGLIRRTLNLSITDFAKIIKVSPHELRLMENGYLTVDASVITLLKEKYHISYDWYYLGQGPIIKKAENTESPLKTVLNNLNQYYADKNPQELNFYPKLQFSTPKRRRKKRTKKTGQLSFMEMSSPDPQPVKVEANHSRNEAFEELQIENLQQKIGQELNQFNNQYQESISRLENNEMLQDQQYAKLIKELSQIRKNLNRELVNLKESSDHQEFNYMKYLGELEMISSNIKTEIRRKIWEIKNVKQEASNLTFNL